MRTSRNTLKFYRAKLIFKAASFNAKLFSLPDYFKDLIGDKKEVNIAELGAGMFCTIGSLWEGCKVNMYASDILADEFNVMLKEYNIVPLVPVVKEDMEQLTYQDNFFDIVHCANALDHVLNPRKALEEMYRVCKPGGYIYLKHFTNVGELERYQGFHQWNIEKVGADVKIWSKIGQFLLTELFTNFNVSYVTEGEFNNIIVITIQK